MSTRRKCIILVLMGFLISKQVQSAGEFSFSDDFSKYAQGSDGSPIWWTSMFGWEIKNKAMCFEFPSREFSILDKAPYGSELKVEAILTLRDATGTNWKIAGVVVWADKENYWHMALAEKPDSMDKGHFIELVEMLDGKWLSHANLTPIPGVVWDNWEYDRPYRLRIELCSESITGIVEEVDGTPRYKKGFKFTNNAVKYGKPGIDSGGFKSEFRNFNTKISKVSEMAPVRAEEKVFPKYELKGIEQIKGKVTGFFHAEQIDGIWWVIDPNGNGFYAIGTDHIRYQGHWCEALGYAPYGKNTQKKYGSEDAWANSSTDRLKQWGFNLIGAGGSDSTFYKGLAHTLFASMGGKFSGMGDDFQICYPVDKKPTPGSQFPNVFHPKFVEFCEKEAEKYKINAKDPWLFGYFFDNELKWWGDTPWGSPSKHGLFESVMKKPAEHSAKKALLEWLKNRYKDIAEFNNTWGANLESFEKILDLNSLDSTNKEIVEKDKVDFVRLIADKYFSTISEAIKKYDPNHIMLGCRFAGGNAPSYEPIWESAGKYCDIVSFNYYGNVDLEKQSAYSYGAYGAKIPLIELFTAFYKLAKKPLMITEWSFPSYDSGLPCKHGAGQRVNTQEERSLAFEIYQKMLFSLPFMVGSDFFMWVDEPALGIASHFPEDSNYGLVNEQDEPWTLLTQTATRTNAMVYKIHSGMTQELRVRSLKEGIFKIENYGEKDAECNVSLWVDGKFNTQKIEIESGKFKEISVDKSVIGIPGGHFFYCVADSERTLFEMNRMDNSDSQFLYVKSAGKEKFQSIPVIIANPEPKDAGATTLILKLNELTNKINRDKIKENIFVISQEKKELPFQVDMLPEAGEIAIEIPPVPAYSARTLLVCIGDKKFETKLKPKVIYNKIPLNPPFAIPTREYGIPYRSIGKGEEGGFEIDNGKLKFIKSGSDGDAFDRIEFDEIEVGKFTPLIWQKLKQNIWLPADRIEDWQVFNGSVRLILDIVASYSGAIADLKTQVDEKGTYAGLTQRPHKFRTKYRFAIYPGKSWFVSQFVWLENTDEEAWKMGAYFDYIPSNIAGDFKDDEPGGKFWYDTGTQVCYGAFDPEKIFKINMWKDKGGGEHPDIYCEVNVELKTGQIFKESQPVVYIGCAKGEKTKVWAEFENEIKNLNKLQFKIFNLEN